MKFRKVAFAVRDAPAMPNPTSFEKYLYYGSSTGGFSVSSRVV